MFLGVPGRAPLSQTQQQITKSNSNPASTPNNSIPTLKPRHANPTQQFPAGPRPTSGVDGASPVALAGQTHARVQIGQRIEQRSSLGTINTKPPSNVGDVPSVRMVTGHQADIKPVVGRERINGPSGEQPNKRERRSFSSRQTE